MIGRTCKRSNAFSEAGTNGRGLDLVHATSTLLDRVRKVADGHRSTMIRRFRLRSVLSRGRGRQLKIYPGDASGEEPPVPIPNTEVKLSSAEDTWGATSWENRSSPGYFIVGPVGFARRGLAMLGVVDRVCPLLGLASDRRDSPQTTWFPRPSASCQGFGVSAAV